MFQEIGWCQTFHATPNQRSDAVDNALRVGEPVKDIPHIRRDPAKLRNTAHKTGCRSQDPVYGFPLGNFYGFFPLRNFSPTFYTGHFPKGISMDFSRLLHYLTRPCIIFLRPFIPDISPRKFLWTFPVYTLPRKFQ